MQHSNDRINVILILLAVVLGAGFIGFAITKTNFQFAMICAIGFGLVLTTFYNTKLAIYILIFSMLLSPEIGYRSTSGKGFTIRFDDIILSIIIFTWIAKSTINNQLKMVQTTFMHKTFTIYFIICIISTGLGIIRQDVNLLTGFFFIFKYFQYFMIFFIVISFIKTKKDIHDFFKAIYIVYTIVIIITVISIPTTERLSSPFEGKQGEPNTLGGYLLLISTTNLGIIYFCNSIKKFNKKLIFITTIISIIPLLFTNSRGSWLAGIPVIFSFILLRKSRFPAILLLAVILLVGPIMLPEKIVDRFQYTFKEQQGYGRTLQEEVGNVILDPSASERVRSWVRVVNDLPKHLLLGFGITGWQFLDSQYMRALIETGIFGLLALLYFIYSILKSAWIIQTNAKDTFFKGLSFGFFIATIAMAFHAISANTFIIIRIMEPFYLLCGMVFAIPFVEQNQEKEKYSEQTKISQNQRIPSI